MSDPETAEPAPAHAPETQGRQPKAQEQTPPETQGRQPKAHAPETQGRHLKAQAKGSPEESPPEEIDHVRNALLARLVAERPTDCALLPLSGPRVGIHRYGKLVVIEIAPTGLEPKRLRWVQAMTAAGSRVIVVATEDEAVLQLAALGLVKGYAPGAGGHPKAHAPGAEGGQPKAQAKTTPGAASDASPSARAGFPVGKPKAHAPGAEGGHPKAQTRSARKK